MKRRRFNGDNHQPVIHRVMPPRYGAVPAGTPVGPGTPFPFAQASHPHPQMFAPAHVSTTTHTRRESLPGLRGVVSPPGPMAPPPRPGMGYQQHRMSQGHITPDRSLQLPPLQTGSIGSAPASAKLPVGQSVDEAIMSMPFEAKLAILRKIAPPKALDKSAPRGPLIAIEGDNAEAVAKLAQWLSETLRKDSELSVKLLDSPDVALKGGRDDAMAEYHMLVAHWLKQSKEIIRGLGYASTANGPDTAKLSNMDTPTTATPTPASSRREVDENYNDDDMEESGDKATPTKSSTTNNTQIDSAHPTATSSPSKKTNAITDIMDVDDQTAPANTKTSNTTTSQAPAQSTLKPITLLPLFSLYASNTFACRIPILDTYAPADHWSWNATQWRGVVGADLTIYLKDDVNGEERVKMVEQSEEERLFVVSRKTGGGDFVDGATLRRVGFEVGEWVRGFGEGL